MNQPSLDLSNLPADIRGRVEMALLKLPPEQRQQFLKHGSPLLNKLVARVEQSTRSPGGTSQRTSSAPPPLPTHTATPSKPINFARQVPSGHFNQTVQPGDRRGLGMLWLVVAAIAVTLAWNWLR